MSDGDVVTSPHRSFVSDFRRNFVAGLFVFIPIAFTLWVLHKLFTWLSDLGQPIIDSVIRSMSVAPRVDIERVRSMQRTLEVFKDAISFVLVVILIYLLGWATTKVVGRRLLGLFDNLVHRIPLAKGIYSTVKQLLSTFQTERDGARRVVLIDFPSDRMKSIGFVTRTFHDADTGRELAAVFMPTSPSPHSGFLRVVPVEDVTNTDWTVDEAMRFIVSGGAAGPIDIRFDRNGVGGDTLRQPPVPAPPPSMHDAPRA